MAADESPSIAVHQQAFAGFCAGIVGTVLGFPLDTIKTKMQTSQMSAVEAIKTTQNQHGFKGFYRGVGSPLISLTILNTLNFSSYGYFCKQLNIQGITAEDKITSFQWKYGLAAACVGPIASLISTPFELVKTKLQLAKKSSIPGQEKIAGGTIRMASAIVKSEGISGLYHGHLVNTIREIVFLSTYFITYEHFKVYALNELNLSMPISTALSGGISGALGWLISFPLDNIKSNIQGLPIDLIHTRKTAIQIGKEILAKKGIVGLYAGVGPSIARAFIVSASRFSAYEYALTIVE